MSMKTLTHKLIALLLCGALLLSACSGLQPSATPAVDAPEIQDVSPLISATGVVNPEQYSTLSMSTAGLVAEVLVKRGDHVEAGQTLVRLEGREEQQAAIAGAKFELQAAEKGLDDLNDVAETAKIAALDAMSLYAKMVRDADYKLDNYEVPTDQEDLDPWEAVQIMKEALDKARAAFDEVKSRSSSDPVRKDRKEDLDEAQSDYNAAIRRLEFVTALDVAQANLDKARKDYEKWKDGPDPKDVAVAQARIDNAKASLAAAESSLTDLELHAPFSGTISEVYARVGEWIAPSAPVALLADLTHLRVETTDLNEIDAARVQVDAAVKVTFDALPDVVIQGVVKSIAPKASAGSGVNYTAIIELAETPEALRWGMTAFVDIEVVKK